MFHMNGPTDLLHPSPAPHFKTFKVFVISSSMCPSFSTKQYYATEVEYHYFLRQSTTNLLPKIVFFLLNVAEKYTARQKQSLLTLQQVLHGPLFDTVTSHTTLIFCNTCVRTSHLGRRNIVQ